LAWWRIRNSELAATATGLLLRDAYRHLRLAARLHEREIKNDFALLRTEGIEPVLVKGWASARMYPDAALRPYGDIDLCVRPDQFARAAEVIKQIQTATGPFVDLHDGFASIGRVQRPMSKVQSPKLIKDQRPKAKDQSPELASWHTIFARSRLVSLDGEQIRILSDEDHLRIICLHLLQSGGWRPLWLCDVAVALDQIKDDFDWTICLGSDQRHAEWAAATIALARELLISRQEKDRRQTAVGSRQESASSVNRHRAPAVCLLPTASWLRSAVLRHWGRERPADRRAMHLGQLLFSGLSPAQLISEVYARWDNPVRATVNTRGRINQWPRLPHQLGELLRRAPELPRELGTRFLVSFSPRL
jgi:hypothetical protein